MMKMMKMMMMMMMMKEDENDQVQGSSMNYRMHQLDERDEGATEKGGEKDEK